MESLKKIEEKIYRLQESLDGVLYEEFGAVRGFSPHYTETIKRIESLMEERNKLIEFRSDPCYLSIVSAEIEGGKNWNEDWAEIFGGVWEDAQSAIEDESVDLAITVCQHIFPNAHYSISPGFTNLSVPHCETQGVSGVPARSLMSAIVRALVK